MTDNASTSSRTLDTSGQQCIEPGKWLGVLGGGQLGRMFTHAAQRMGYHVAIFEPEVECPAGQVAEKHFCSTLSDVSSEQLVLEMSKLCSVMTLEFENIPTEIVRIAGRVSPTNPSADFLEICQDRLREKEALRQAGFPTTPFQSASSADEVRAAGQTLGWPLVLKTVRSGYDGKGQAIVRSADEVSQVWEQLGTDLAIAEQWIEFDAEVSMIAARNARGQIECYPLLENDHANHILDITRCPVSNHLRHLESHAVEICRGIATNFGVLGLFCVEFFVSGSGELMINEMAPRPHNSGHLTIEAFTCSQFEQQVRAICNLPLVPPTMLRPAAMANLMGELWQAGPPDWQPVLAVPAAHLHLYGKSEARNGRKMGHLTVLDESSSEAAITARELRDSLARNL
jgi:5-(carboxyamino)imidazole ribonucleotide synthase